MKAILALLIIALIGAGLQFLLPREHQFWMPEPTPTPTPAPSIPPMPSVSTFHREIREILGKLQRDIGIAPKNKSEIPRVKFSERAPVTSELEGLWRDGQNMFQYDRISKEDAEVYAKMIKELQKASTTRMTYCERWDSRVTSTGRGTSFETSDSKSSRLRMKKIIEGYEDINREWAVLISQQFDKSQRELRQLEFSSK